MDDYSGKLTLQIIYVSMKFVDSRYNTATTTFGEGGGCNCSYDYILEGVL